MREDWIETELVEVCGVHDNLRKPINSKERSKRIEGKRETELFPYYGATGKVGFIDDFLTDGEYVLIGEDGAPFLDYTKNVAYIIRGKAWVNNHAHILSSFFNNQFLLHYLNSFNYHGYVSGTTRLKLTQGALKKIPIRLAPLPEQRAIVAKIEQLFSELDHGIANLNAAKRKLEIYRQAVLKKAFEGELTKEWREQNPYSETDIDELLEYIEDFNAIKSGQDIPRRLPPIDLNYLYELPYGWIWQEAHKICSSVRDGTHDTPKYVEEGVPLVTSKNLKNGVIDIENVDLISEIDHEDICRRSAVEENDILYGMIGTIGNPVIVKQTKAFSIKNIGLFKKHETLLIPKYFQYYLSSWIVEHIMRQKELIRGTTQKFVALGGLRVLPIPLPSIKEQEQIIYVIESRLSVCDSILSNIEEGLEKSEALRQSILKKAFEGRLLSDEELAACRKEVDWEPAEKLLARIKEEKRTGR